MLEIGKYNQLKGAREVEFGFYLTDGETEILLPRKYVPAGFRVGDAIDVFVYCDSEDRPIATTRKPLAAVGDVRVMRVKDVSPVGAFLDWGLEKDLLVPFREQLRKMDVGQEYLVRVYLDPVTHRVLASSRIRPLMRGNPAELKLDQEVELIVCDVHELGYPVLIDRRYGGMLYRNEIFRELAVGETLRGYVGKVRSDGKVDVRLRPSGFKGVSAGKTPVLDALREAGGFLPFNAKTPAETIRERFQMSRKDFKQRIGMLYKERLIRVTEDGIELTEAGRGERS